MPNVRQVLNLFKLAPTNNGGKISLADDNIARKIVEKCNLSGEDYVLEIGPGLGALTPLAG